jgi:hypothetical protein
MNMCNAEKLTTQNIFILIFFFLVESTELCMAYFRCTYISCDAYCRHGDIMVIGHINSNYQGKQFVKNSRRWEILAVVFI